MSRRHAAGLMIALALVALGFYLTYAAGDKPATASPVRHVPEQQRAEAREDGERSGNLVKPSLPPQTEATETTLPRHAPREPIAQETSAPRLAELRGRFLDGNGAPVAAVALNVHGWGANQERKNRFGLPSDWKDPSGQSAPDGRFSLTFDPPRAFQFTLDAKAIGFSEVSWRWGEILPGEIKDLGDVTLVRGGSIEVRIVDAGGNVLTDGWMVYADAIQPPGGDEGSEPARGFASAPTAENYFLVSHMPPGPVRLKADSRIANWVDGPMVEVIGGETVRAEIKYLGPDNARRITVVTFSRPFYVVNTEPEFIHLQLPDGSVRNAEKIPQSSQSHSFDDLPDGEYRIWIDDPRFLPWAQDGVKPGVPVNAKLKGSAALAIQVFDDATGVAVTEWTARLRFENARFSPVEFPLVEAKDGPPASGLVEGVVPGDFTLLVNAKGYGQASVAIHELVAGEVRPVPVRLTLPGSIVGQVRYGDGGAIPHVDVGLLPWELEPEEPQDGAARSRWVMERFQRQRARRLKAVVATTDEHGNFAFEELAAGSYDLMAEVAGLGMRAEVKQVAVGKTTRVTLETPGRSFLSGVCHGPENASFADLRIELEGQREASNPFESSKIQGAIDAQGNYRVGPTPSGSYSVRLLLPDSQNYSDSSSWTIPGQARDLGTVALVAGENTGHDFDLREFFPGRLVLTVTRSGVPASGCRAHLFAIPSPGDKEPQMGGVSTANEVRVSLLDEKGVTAIGPLMPGEYLALVEVGGASVLVPGIALIRAGGESSLTHDVQLFDGALTILNAETGEAMPDHDINLAPLSPVAGLRLTSATRVKTDAKGSCKLALAPGSYVVSDGPASLAMLARPQGIVVTWGPGGSAQTEVLLSPAKHSGFPGSDADK